MIVVSCPDPTLSRGNGERVGSGHETKMIGTVIKEQNW